MSSKEGFLVPCLARNQTSPGEQCGGKAWLVFTSFEIARYDVFEANPGFWAVAENGRIIVAQNRSKVLILTENFMFHCLLCLVNATATILHWDHPVVEL